jgi:hypothetical protein
MMDYGKNEYKVRSKRVTKNDCTKEITITQVENGYIVCVTTTDMVDGEYKVTKKKWISKEDPMPDKKGKVKDEEPTSVAQAIKYINF